jgi:hypothetical protein
MNMPFLKFDMLADLHLTDEPVDNIFSNNITTSTATIHCPSANGYSS